MFLEPICPWFWRLNSPTKGLFQSNQRSFEVPGMGIPENSEPKKMEKHGRWSSFSKGWFSGNPCLLDFPEKHPMGQGSMRFLFNKGPVSGERPPAVSISQAKKTLENRLWNFIETSNTKCFLNKNVGWFFEPVLLPKPIQVCFVGHLTSAVLFG